MKKSIILLLLCHLVLSPQVKGQSMDAELRSFLHVCLDSFKTKNEVKHSKIKGLHMIFKKDGRVKKYMISFSDKKIKLNVCEYRWLLRLFRRKNYLIYVMPFYSELEFKQTKYLHFKIKYAPFKYKN